MDRAFGVLEFRAVDEEQRIIEGIASSDMLDDHGTVLEPQGARYSLPLPLLWQHDAESPVGEVISAQVVGNQIRVRAQIRKITEAGAFKELTDKAWQGVKHRLVRGFSVGFIPRKQVKNRYIEWALRELSLVTIPSNSEATIQFVRSAFAASGDSSSPGVSGNPNPTIPRRKMKNVQEQIQDHANSRAAKVAAQQALMEKAEAEGRTLDESEAESFDTLDTEIRSIDGHLARLGSLQRANEAAAVPVNGRSIAKASESRSGVPVVSVKPNTAPGIGFARYAMSLAACGGNRFEAAQYAKRSWGDSADEIVGALENRAAIAAGTTLDSTFAAPLVQTNYLAEFLELLRPATLIGRIPGLRRVPFNVSMPAQTAGGTYNWVGQGAAKPLTNMAFSSVTLGMAKAAGIIVLTEELVRSSAPSAQEAVRDELIKGITAFLDDQFVDTAVTAVANVSPASITNGVTGSAASGTTGAAAAADFGTLVGGFATNNYSLANVVILMSETVAFNLGLMRNSDGSKLFPNISVAGGNIEGIPVVTSNVIGTDIFAVHTPSILVADDGGVDVAVSREASLQMDSEPDNPSDGDTVMVSLFQRNLVALRGERFINWKKARSTAVTRIHTVAYVPGT
jgi:HK97 family phage major capsid protein/HK97 family phage prohead protease